ncbi:MAG: hypothetical protein ACLR3C_08735 [Eggerthella lenta]
MDEVLALDLEHLEACHPMALSGGQKQRLAWPAPCSPGGRCCCWTSRRAGLTSGIWLR